MMIRIKTIATIVWLEMLRKKDIYVLLILLVSLLLVLVSLNVFGLSGTVRYIKDAGLLLTWIAGWILAITTSTREIPQEESRGTIYPLLAKPITRFEYIAGKWIGCWMITGAAVFLFYLATFAVVLLRGGYFNVPAVVQAYVLHLCALAIIIAVGILFSTRMNNDAAATMTAVLTIASFAVTPKVPAFLAKASGLHAILLDFLYHLMPHFEVLDMRRRIIHNYGPVSMKTFAIATAYGLAMAAVFIVLAWLAYRKKCFSRSNVYGR